MAFLNFKFLENEKEFNELKCKIWDGNEGKINAQKYMQIVRIFMENAISYVKEYIESLYYGIKIEAK